MEITLSNEVHGIYGILAISMKTMEFVISMEFHGMHGFYGILMKTTILARLTGRKHPRIPVTQKLV